MLTPPTPDQWMALPAQLARKRGQRFIKRLLDMLIALGGLAVLWPFLLVFALIIKIQSPGPVFYRQVRVGKNGVAFHIFKFRTMVVNADRLGERITVSQDPRVTPVGSWLRKYKIDELPQLINVLLGQMSLVGPRPEVPEYVAFYTPPQRQVLLVRPGITDIASLAYRDENRLLACEDPRHMYIHTIMPAKLTLNYRYLAHFSIGLDLALVVQTVLAVLGSEPHIPYCEE